MVWLVPLRGTLSDEMVLGVGELGPLGDSYQVRGSSGMGVLRAGVLGRSPASVGVYRNRSRFNREPSRDQQTKGQSVIAWLVTHRERLCLACLTCGMAVGYVTAMVCR